MRATTDRRPLAVCKQDSSSRQRSLELRLDDGYQRIEQGLRDGIDVDAWETFWLQLLAEYESLSDDLAAAA